MKSFNANLSLQLESDEDEKYRKVYDLKIRIISNNFEIEIAEKSTLNRLNKVNIL